MRPRRWPAEVTRAFDMVRADRARRSRVLTGSSLTFGTARSDAQFLRSQIGAENGAPRQRAGAELSAGHEGELARSKRIPLLHALASHVTALRTPLPKNSSDFGLLCAQVYATTGHCSSLVDFQQCRARFQPA